jgi:TRAP-type C4-dicarboxylate transport system substrate-binding protein
MTNEADKPKTNEELQKENQKLAELLLEKNELLQEAQETLEAIRSGAVDGIVRSTHKANKFTSSKALTNLTGTSLRK